MDHNRPPKCKYPNCFECVYVDCRFEQLTIDDIKRQDEFDKSLELIEPEIMLRRKSQKQYGKTEKGIERTKRYEATEKAKERKKRYQKTDKFKERQKEYNKSDKGKERWRRYYYKKKLERARKEEGL